MKYYTTVVFSLMMLLCVVNVIAGTSPVNLRLQVAHYDESEDKMLVNVQLEYDQAGSINLASQNYRFFFDSDALELNTKESQNLLGSDYSDLKWATTISGMNADEVNKLSFDNDLGFANFSIALNDNLNGGKAIKTEDGWVSVAQLAFDVKEDADLYHVVWGQKEVTAEYATAFVELGEWKDSETVDLLEVKYFGNLAIEREELEAQANLQYKVGPNPTSDFVILDLQESLSSDAKILVQDFQGQTHIDTILSAGETYNRIDLSNLASATYILRVVGDNDSIIETTIAVTR